MIPKVQSYLMTRDFTLEEALDRLSEYTGIPPVQDPPLIFIGLCLMDDIVTPTPDELVAIAPKLRHESISR
jgi:hypothetical protein